MNIWHIARKEISDGLRNRWLLAISLLFAILAAGIAWFGSATAGQVGFSSIAATIASLASLATFLVPLIALLLAYDSIVGEDEGGTLLLLLTYPLGRGQLLLGKFAGHGVILALATLLGFGSAALAIGLLVPDVDLQVLLVSFVRFILSATLLGWVFLAMAYVLSALAREKSTAAGLALGVWFVFVLVFDLALLALLVFSQGKLSPALLPYLLLFNPTDIFRQLNIMGLDENASLEGVMSLASELPLGNAGLWLSLMIWLGVMLAAAHFSLKARKI
ncbi:ABC transporter permease subunit [Bowmanella dokdonensis]|uniref:ABC transporter permease n=1 Tax=Bowmanella dokdonensis TaxID=751969 RepID=A0A939IPT7_9ALTE|nr:ABC transporter permease [Bowmanella dokdonensis]